MSFLTRETAKNITKDFNQRFIKEAVKKMYQEIPTCVEDAMARGVYTCSYILPPAMYDQDTLDTILENLDKMFVRFTIYYETSRVIRLDWH